MTVRVTVSRDGYSEPEKVDDFAEASSITVKEGHLLVQKYVNTQYTSVAIYAPGKWVNAEVVGS